APCGYCRTPLEQPSSSATAPMQPRARRRAPRSKATGRSKHETKVFHRAALLEGLRPGSDQDLEHVIAATRRLQPDTERAAEQLQLEAIEVLAEHVAHRVVHGTVHPDPNRPAIGETRGQRAAIPQASRQKSAQRA